MKPGALTLEALDTLTSVAWRRASPDHIESTDGKWQVWKLRTEVPAYTLWRKRGRTFDYVDKFDSSEEAKAASGQVRQA